jgi:uncharacterized protein with PQ loop repeat
MRTGRHPCSIRPGRPVAFTPLETNSMTPASLLGLVAACMGVLMALSPLLQARRVRIARDSSEVSSGVFLVMRVNASAWLLYGVVTANLVLIVPNVVSLATTTVTLFVLRRFRPAGETAETATAPAPLRQHAARVRGGALTVARAGRLVRR